MDLRGLLLDYARCGLLQFGNWEQADGTYAPLAFHFSLLPSFPALLTATAEALQLYTLRQTERDRLLVVPDMIALGGVLATLTHTPLLYPRGEVKAYTAAFAIEGTADVGNPTTLITAVLGDGQLERQMIEVAGRVGVPVQKVVAILDIEQGAETVLRQTEPAIELHSLFTLEQTIGWLVEAGTITDHLAATIRRWHIQLSTP